MNVTTTTTYQINVVNQQVGVYCQDTAVMELSERNLPEPPEVDLTKSDQEAVDQLVDYIEVLRTEYSTLLRTDYKCRLIR